MPSTLQSANGDVNVQVNGNGHTNGVAANESNGHEKDFHDEDAFQHLPKPQQDVLLLHGPRQKYSLQTTGQIPSLRSDREILVQVSR